MCKLFRNINRGQVTDSNFQMYITYNRLKQVKKCLLKCVKNKNKNKCYAHNPIAVPFNRLFNVQ